MAESMQFARKRLIAGARLQVATNFPVALIVR
ncbi:hypothetical protein BH10PSE9_BH10PSE9_02990 [soil metagenome]